MSALAATLVAGVTQTGGAVRYVDHDATGGQTGQSWATAYHDLHSALHYAATHSVITEIHVAGGVYHPTTNLIPGQTGSAGEPRSWTFRLVNYVTITGGYAGNGQIGPPDTRDFLLYESVLSGDLDDDDGGGFHNYEENCRTVVTSDSSNQYAILDGFTISGGYRDGGGGAGVKIYGGGLLFDAPKLTNCVIARNLARGMFASGAGVYIEDYSNPLFEDCTFRDNQAETGAGLYHKYGHSSTGTGVAKLTRCSFIDNVATSYGGGALLAEGTDNVHLTNCLFSGNAALGEGGAIHSFGGSTMTLTNCTLAANEVVCGVGGGGITVASGDMTLTNCILWGNRANELGGQDAQIDVDTSAVIAVSYSCIEGWTDGGTGNINGNPLFVDAGGHDDIVGTPDDNLRLVPSSPCVEAGNNSVWPDPESDVDLDGNARLVDGGGGSAADVDMGSYEYDGELVDCNENTVHDLEDIRLGNSDDCNTNGIPDDCETDCNGNGVADECDLAFGTSLDCDGNGVPSECEGDCDGNCMEDAGEIVTDPELDCDENGVLDACEFSIGRVWTTGDHFEEGTLINVNYGTGNVLHRNTASYTKPLPYLWVAASGRGTIVRISTGTGDAGDILGEYRTAPSVHVNASCFTGPVVSNPSRTTVDLDGSVWAANRDDNIGFDENATGSVVKIGLVIGGERVDADGVVDPNGDYIAPPFDYCTCEDRDGDGLIRTSSGLGDILPWDNWLGEDDDGGVEHAEDECIIRYVRTAGYETRTVAIDRNNNVWVGGCVKGVHVTTKHQSVDGFTGVPHSSGFLPSCGGYGGLVDGNGVLWSARGNGGLLRYDTIAGSAIPPCLDSSYGNYGLGFDGQTGDIWHTLQTNNLVYRIAPDASSVDGYAHSPSESPDHEAQGVAVDRNGHVWVAHSKIPSPPSTTVGHLTTDGLVVGNVDLYLDHEPVPYLGEGPTGVAVDAQGKVWVTNFYTHNVMRIDPTAGPTGEGGFPTGQVDLSVDLAVPGWPDAQPYNYGDMTGMVSLHTSGTGTWSAVHDSGRVKGTTQWDHLVWQGCKTETHYLTIDVRAADTEAGLAAVEYTSVDLSEQGARPLSNILGRFIQVRVRFYGSCPGVPFETPELHHLGVFPYNVAYWCEADCDGDSIPDESEISLGL